MLPWWLFLVLFFALPAGERINRTRYMLLTAGQGAAPVAITTLLGWTDTYLSQAAVYVVSFAISFIFIRPRFMRKNEVIAVDHSASLIGRELVVDQRIEPHAEGSATMEDRPFDVRNVGEESLESGDRCAVRELDEFILLVSKSESGEGAGAPEPAA